MHAADDDDDDGVDDAEGYLIVTDDDGTVISSLHCNVLQLVNGRSQRHKATQGKSWHM